MKSCSLVIFAILCISLQEIECRWIPPCQVVVKKSVLLSFPEFSQSEETEADVCICPIETMNTEDEFETIFESDMDSTEEDYPNNEYHDDDSSDEESGLMLKFDLEQLLSQSDESENEIQDADEDEFTPKINKTNFNDENSVQNLIQTNNFENDLSVLQFPVEVVLSGDLSFHNINIR